MDEENVNVPDSSAYIQCPLQDSEDPEISSYCENDEDEDMLEYYTEAVRRHPEDEHLLNNLGSELYRLGRYCEALPYFLQSCILNPDFLPALRNFEGCCNLLVERWHFRMLNDYCRNAAFKKAILNAVTSGYDTVLDIGTGTGLLSLFAVEAKAKSIYACDCSPLMVYTASKVLEANSITDQVKVINKLSYDLEIPSDLEDRVSLVVSETVDSGLLGEGILEVVLHSWQSLLRPDGRVIPSRAKVWVTAVECPYFASMYKLSKFEHMNINLVLNSEDSYDTVDLDTIPGGLKYLTQSAVAYEIDFNNYEQILAYYQNSLNHTVKITCMQSGTIDALVIWFDLYVDDDNVISSCPGSGSCWEQAVFPVCDKICLKQGDTMELSVNYKNKRLHIFPVEYENMCISQEPEHVFHMNVSEDNEDNNGLTAVPQNILQFLNDRNWVNVIMSAALRIQSPLPAHILDLLPFPIFGLKVLIRNKGSKLWCIAENKDMENAIIRTANMNGVDVCNINFVTEDTLSTLLLDNHKFDVIMAEPLSSTGEFSESRVTQMLSSLRHSLKDGGLLLPAEISVYGQMVKSDWLKKNYKVLNDEVTCGWSIARHFNAYQTSHHLDLNVFSLSYEAHTEPSLLLKLEVEDIPQIKLSHIKEIPATKEGTVNAIIFWYDVKYFNDLCISTLHSGSHINQAAIILPDINVCDKMNIMLDVRYDSGFLDIKTLGPL